MNTRKYVILAAFGFLALAVSLGIRTVNHELATSKPDVVNLPVPFTLGRINHATFIKADHLGRSFWLREVFSVQRIAGIASSAHLVELFYGHAHLHSASQRPSPMQYGK